jgi:hypothetical protein
MASNIYPPEFYHHVRHGTPEHHPRLWGDSARLELGSHTSVRPLNNEQQQSITLREMWLGGVAMLCEG